MIGFTYDDGGRAAAGYKRMTGDCVVRAISIAAQRPYQEVYDEIGIACQKERRSKRRSRKSHPRTGVHKATIKRYLEEHGWSWVPTMAIGSGAKVHLRANELPGGRIIVSLSKHVAAVIDGMVHDLYLDDRDGTRCVYGYWLAPVEVQP